ncbi:MAG: UrcA family protein [Alphaproteobacteria bacterium]|nr:UrcA family protein [Alphaproteobacteria bacterium]
MLGKLLGAALVTMVATAPASLASEAADARNSYVIALGEVDASNPQDLERVMKTFTKAAREACTATGSRLANSRCVKTFVDDAIRSIRRPDLQVALMNGTATGGGIPQAASAPHQQ